MTFDFDIMSDQFTNAIKQLNKTAEIMGIRNNACLELLSAPKRVIDISFPVKMDDGQIKIFHGYRVQYNDALGPFKGGVRYHPEVDIEEVKALGFWMMIKCAATGIPYGGAKGGIAVNPKTLSDSELERLSRAYIRELAPFIGPDKDIPAPDVYTNPQIMAWFMDEFSKISGKNVPGVVTGKPVEIAGSLGRDTATAQGGIYILNCFLEKQKKSKLGLAIAIQGFGNAGSNLAALAEKEGYKVLAISDSKGGIYNERGLEIKKIIEHKNLSGSVINFPGTKNITNEQLLELPVNILVPAALSEAITEENAGSIKAEIVLELANGPTSIKADEILKHKGIIILPDVLSNSGGVIVSYFEWVQNLQNYYWNIKEVHTALRRHIETAFQKIWDCREHYHTDLRTAAYIIAVERLRKAIELRGN